MKHCPRCDTTKLDAEFYRRSDRPGRAAFCITCTLEYDKVRTANGSNRQKQKEYRARMSASPEWVASEKLRRKLWKKNHKPHVLDDKARRRLSVKQQTPKWANASKIRAIYRTASALGHHVDHIIPINSPFVCGLHWEGNLQVLPPLENQIKSNRIREDS